MPYLMELLGPRSVVDVGCGKGGWLAEFARHGVERSLGIDGFYVEEEELLIPRENFQRLDLEQPLEVEAQFDLAVSLEVAEHLSPGAAEGFVKSLTELAPVVFFSAAIPGQGGYQHVNEQWQSYWIEHFAKRGFIVIDAIRPRFWGDGEIRFWYRQNGFLFANSEVLEKDEVLLKAGPRGREVLADIVHPEQYNQKLYNPGVRHYAGLLPSVLRRALMRRK